MLDFQDLLIVQADFGDFLSRAVYHWADNDGRMFGFDGVLQRRVVRQDQVYKWERNRDSELFTAWKFRPLFIS